MILTFMTESEIERKLVFRVNSKGGKAIKLSADIENGVPDRIVLLPNGTPFFVEVKTEKGKLTPLQLHYHLKLKTMGFQVFVIRNTFDIDNLFKNLEI